jgi:hypothetical protein
MLATKPTTKQPGLLQPAVYVIDENAQNDANCGELLTDQLHDVKLQSQQ